MITASRSDVAIATTSSVRRVAAYARLSVSSDKEFSSIDAQVESITAYVRGRAREGWILAAPAYVDDGRTGGNLERPSLQALLADVEARKLDVVVVTRIDRLSRSLLDFARLIDLFERRDVTFVSTVQDFNSTTASGRLMLSMLMGFAQYERDTIRERTSAKMAAQRRRGMWCGGVPTLGYRIENRCLVVVESEAERVREVYRLYLERKSILAVVEEVNRLGWRTKTHTRSDGTTKGGGAYSAETIHATLTNPVNAGLVRAGDELVPGVHEGIVDRETWHGVQAQLKANRVGGPEKRRRHSRSLLGGLIYCAVCSRALSPAYGGGTKKYGAYECAQRRQRGAAACPNSRISMRVLDAAVVAQIHEAARDPAIFASTFKAVRRAQSEKRPELEAERHRIDTELQRLGEARANLASAVADGSKGRPAILETLGSVELHRHRLTARLREIRAELDVLESGSIDEDGLRRGLDEFNGIWDSLVVEERRRLLDLFIERITFDARSRELAISFRAAGLRSLAEQHEESHE